MSASELSAAPPMRVIDTQLVQRVASGMAGEWEAVQVEGMLAWLALYERVLRHIAAHGSGWAAMMAAQVMSGCDPFASGDQHGQPR